MKKITRTVTVSIVSVLQDDGSTEIMEIVEDKELLILLRKGARLIETKEIKCSLTLNEFYHYSKQKKDMNNEEYGESEE